MSSPSTPVPTPEGPGSVSEAPHLPAGFADTFANLAPNDRTELREGYAEVGDVRLHYVEAGDDSPSPTATTYPTSTAWSACPTASHWVHHDEAERVNQLLIDFFAPAA